jgi:hypothetical protein
MMPGFPVCSPWPADQRRDGGGIKPAYQPAGGVPAAPEPHGQPSVLQAGCGRAARGYLRGRRLHGNRPDHHDAPRRPPQGGRDRVVHLSGSPTMTVTADWNGRRVTGRTWHEQNLGCGAGASGRRGGRPRVGFPETAPGAAGGWWLTCPVTRGAGSAVTSPQRTLTRRHRTSACPVLAVRAEGARLPPRPDAPRLPPGRALLVRLQRALPRA